MPTYELQIKAQLENVTGLKAPGDDESFRWYLRLKCCACGEETEHHQYITSDMSQPLKGGRGNASLVIKCKLCSRENSIDLMKDSLRSYNIDDTNKFKTIVKFDCRGVEPLDFEPRMGWDAKSSESTTQFEDVDLTDKEWTEYDEKANVSVSIMELESRFVKGK